MNLDWVSVFLPIINATGIPLLAVGIILLLRAYQKSGETYKETSDHLKEENERLRKRLNDADTVYFSEIEKMRAVVSGSVEAIKELQARKIALLSKADEANKELTLQDVYRINQAIEELHELSTIIRLTDSKIRESLQYINHSFQSRTFNVSELADQISDTKSRVAIVSAITSVNTFKELVSEVEKEKIGRGLVALPYERKKHDSSSDEEKSSSDEEEKKITDNKPDKPELPQNNEGS